MNNDDVKSEVVEVKPKRGRPRKNVDEKIIDNSAIEIKEEVQKTNYDNTNCNINKKHDNYQSLKNGLLYLLVFFLGIAFTIWGIYIFKDELFQGEASGNGICYTACENKVTITDNGSISAAVEKVYDAVVLVQNYVNNKLYSTGTGFVYKVDSKYGYLLTNYHVIKNNTSIKLVMSDDSVVDAEYVGGDQYIDVAVLRIDREYVKKVAELGDSTKIKLGDTTFTVGSPVGYEYRGTVTRGILSGKDRLVTVELDTNNAYIMKVLQTDAAINQGNSGGPLVNSNGEVIGITSSKLVNTSIESMGFAIPIEDVIGKLEVFERGDDIARPLLGISMLNVTDTYSLYRMGIILDEGIDSGVVVVAVQSGSSASNVLEKGDVIVALDNQEIKSDAYLKYELFKHEVGDTIQLTIMRDNKMKKVSVTLKEK